MARLNVYVPDEPADRARSAEVNVSAIVQMAAWARRGDIRLLGALYVELASPLRIPLLTADRKLARVCGIAEALTA